MERWTNMDFMGYSNYEVSDQGRIRNATTGHHLSTPPMMNGTLRAGLISDEDGRQHTVVLAHAVGEAFVPNPNLETFNGLINLNGDRRDCRAVNLAWRPRWFVVKYMRQFGKEFVHARDPIIELETQKIYAGMEEVLVDNGLLEADVVHSLVSNTPTFPTWQKFALV